MALNKEFAFKPWFSTTRLISIGSQLPERKVKSRLTCDIVKIYSDAVSPKWGLIRDPGTGPATFEQLKIIHAKDIHAIELHAGLLNQAKRSISHVEGLSLATQPNDKFKLTSLETSGLANSALTLASFGRRTSTWKPGLRWMCLTVAFFGFTSLMLYKNKIYS